MNNDINLEQPEYAKFWIRAGAYILDGLVLFIVTFPLMYWNITYLKSFLLYLVIAIIGIGYKPLMEHHYGATVGKMALNLKVTDLNFKRIDLQQSFLRSFILIFPMALNIPLYYLAFDNPEVVNTDSFIEFGSNMATNYPFFQGLISKLTFITLILEIVFLLSDRSKKERALHDRIGKTYVIKVKR
jgi:uncharacterized RDD family membrane protein YckC